jgi:hypothetical protein
VLWLLSESASGALSDDACSALRMLLDVATKGVHGLSLSHSRSHSLSHHSHTHTHTHTHTPFYLSFPRFFPVLTLSISPTLNLTHTHSPHPFRSRSRSLIHSHTHTHFLLISLVISSPSRSLFFSLPLSLPSHTYERTLSFNLALASVVCTRAHHPMMVRMYHTLDKVSDVGAVYLNNGTC